MVAPTFTRRFNSVKIALTNPANFKMFGKVAVAMFLAVALLAFVHNPKMSQSAQVRVAQSAASTLLSGTWSSSPETTAYKCSKPLIDADKLQFLSQSEEDKTLMNHYFTNLCGGTYIEMGALDGKTYSNSFVFNQGYGWKGVLIEASPVSYKKLVKNRPNEIAVVQSAVCAERRTLHFVDVPRLPQVNGILEFADPVFMKKWWDPEEKTETPIECAPLGELLDTHAPQTQYFDFFSLDIEGAEFEALSTLDFDRLAFGVILVEGSAMQYKNVMIQSLLESKGYKFVIRQNRSLWFYNTQFASIYNGVLN